MKHLCLLFVIALGLARVSARAAEPPAAKPVRATADNNVLAEFDFPRDDGLITVPVRVGGKTYRFIIDTGTTNTAYDASLKRFLGKPIDHAKAETASKSIHLDLYKAPDAHMGPISLRGEDPVAVLDLSLVRQAAGVEIYGIVGRDILTSYVMQVDFDRGKLRFLRSARPPRTNAVALDLDTDTCSVKANLTGLATSQTFQLDTGFKGTIGLKATVLDRLIALRCARKPHPTMSADMGGISHGWAARLDSFLEVGSFTHAHLLADSATENRLGLDYLSRYVVTFDFPQAWFYLQKGKGFDKPDRAGRWWGLYPAHRDGKWIVLAVTPDSPAAVAGIQPNDIFRQVAGKPVDSLTGAQLAGLMDSAGKELGLSIRRGTRLLNVALKSEPYDSLELAKGRPAVASASTKPAEASSVHHEPATGYSNVLADFPIHGARAFILVPVRVGRTTYQFLVSTGAPNTFYDASLTKLLGKPVRQMQYGTPDNPQRMDLFEAPDARMGPIPLGHAALVGTLNLSALRQVAGEEIHGILGLRDLTRYIMRVDFDRGRLTFLRPTAAPPANAVALPLDTALCSIAGHVEGLPLPQRFRLNTGSTGGVALKPELLGRLVASGSVRSNGAGVSKAGSGQFQLGDEVRLPRSLEVGGFKHKNLLVVSGQDNAVGLDYLSRYVVTFDFPHGQLYLEKGREFSKWDEDDKWGLCTLCLAGKWTVFAVAAHSVAADAGLRPKDVLVSIDGKAINSLAAYQLYRLMTGARQELHLGIQRDKEMLNITLKVRERSSPRPAGGRSVAHKPGDEAGSSKRGK